MKFYREELWREKNNIADWTVRARAANHSAWVVIHLCLSLPLLSCLIRRVSSITTITARMTDVFVFSPPQFSPF